eukprot:2742871-Alexandrium_andersonii.AAC.1
MRQCWQAGHLCRSATITRARAWPCCRRGCCIDDVIGASQTGYGVPPRSAADAIVVSQVRAGEARFASPLPPVARTSACALISPTSSRR